jgi:tetratricopeptide (TPR) repeat protein
MTHQVTGFLLTADGFFEKKDTLIMKGVSEFEEAVKLDPGDSSAHAYLAHGLIAAGRPEVAMTHITEALRLDPHPLPWFIYLLGMAQFNMEDFEAAATSFERATHANPDDQYPFLALAATYGHLGRVEEAAKAVARYNVLDVRDGYTPVAVSTAPLLSLWKPADRQRLLEGLRLAGLPQSLFNAEFGVKNRLTTEDIHSIMFGHLVGGRSFETDAERAASITNVGLAIMSGDWGTITNGNAQIEGGRLCIGLHHGAKYCGTLYRNPGGTRKKQNEYIWYDDVSGRFMTFSQID